MLSLSFKLWALFVCIHFEYLLFMGFLQCYLSIYLSILWINLRALNDKYIRGNSQKITQTRTDLWTVVSFSKNSSALVLAVYVGHFCTVWHDDSSLLGSHRGESRLWHKGDCVGPHLCGVFQVISSNMCFLLWMHLFPKSVRLLMFLGLLMFFYNEQFFWGAKVTRDLCWFDGGASFEYFPFCVVSWLEVVVPYVLGKSGAASFVFCPEAMCMVNISVFELIFGASYVFSLSNRGLIYNTGCSTSIRRWTIFFFPTVAGWYRGIHAFRLDFLVVVSHYCLHVAGAAIA